MYPKTVHISISPVLSIQLIFCMKNGSFDTISCNNPYSSNDSFSKLYLILVTSKMIMLKLIIHKKSLNYLYYHNILKFSGKLIYNAIKLFNHFLTINDKNKSRHIYIKN